jgi:hypothetical protein
MAAFIKKIEIVICERGTVIEDRALPPDALLYSRFIHEETPFSLSASLHRNIQVRLIEVRLIEVRLIEVGLQKNPVHVKKPGCPARPSSVAVLLRRAEKSGDEWPKWLFL